MNFLCQDEDFKDDIFSNSMMASYNMLNSSYSPGLEAEIVSFIPKVVEAMGSDNPEIY
jgi:hypothetical protein